MADSHAVDFVCPEQCRSRFLLWTTRTIHPQGILNIYTKFHVIFFNSSWDILLKTIHFTLHPGGA